MKIHVVIELIQNVDSIDDLSRLFSCCSLSVDLPRAVRITDLCEFEVVDMVPRDYFMLGNHYNSGDYVLFGKGLRHGQTVYNVDTSTLKAVKLSEDERVILTDAKYLGLFNIDDMKEAKRLAIKPDEPGYFQRFEHYYYIKYFVSLAALPILKRITE